MPPGGGAGDAAAEMGRQPSRPKNSKAHRGTKTFSELVYPETAARKIDATARERRPLHQFSGIQPKGRNHLNFSGMNLSHIIIHNAFAEGLNLSNAVLEDSHFDE